MFEKFRAGDEFVQIKENYIYVICPANLVTGGPELLHQLVNKLVKRKKNAFIVYSPLGNKWETPKEYMRYDCPVAQNVPDRKDVVIIVPEVDTHLLLKFGKARQVVWWLSVDNYFVKLYNWKYLIGRLQKFLRLDILSLRRSTHLFQSEYARVFVCKRFKSNGAMLSDYLASEYLAPALNVSKKNVVAYNPKKGLKYTKKLIDESPEINFLPLENMSRIQIKSALDACKIYLDFGDHPGKDRLPREAAMRGAVVIVGKEGSANYEKDMPLNSRYKIDRCESSLSEIKKLVCDIFSNYHWHYAEQASYRENISREPEVFEKQINYIFSINNDKK